MTLKNPHEDIFLGPGDVAALIYARDLAEHMLECEGVVHSEIWKDLPSYREGFKTGCMAVYEALDHALDRLKANEQGNENHDK